MLFKPLGILRRDNFDTELNAFIADEDSSTGN